MFNGMTTIEIIKMTMPLIVIEIGLFVFCIVKIRNDKVKYLPKWAWVLILFIEIVGPIIYLTVGRERD